MPDDLFTASVAPTAFSQGGTFSGEFSAIFELNQVISGSFTVKDPSGNSFVLNSFTTDADQNPGGIATQVTASDNSGDRLVLPLDGGPVSFYEGSILKATAKDVPYNWVVTCFCPGTMILTSWGECPVESLSIGDTVVTAFGAHRRVKWVGRRTYDGRFISGNHLALPVRIQADAIASHIPERDLHVSPGHAIYLDGVLVPAWRLVNGISITQATAVDRIAYLHVELDEHDVIVAENCPVESFFGDAFRRQFQNAAEFYALYPEDEGRPKSMCAPRVEEGFHLQAIQRRLRERSGLPHRAVAEGSLRGFVDQGGPDIVQGWAQDRANPEEPVVLDILAAGRRVLRVLANGYRADLRRAQLGSGCHAFTALLPPGCPTPIEVRRASDGAVLTLTKEAMERAA